MPGGSLGRFLTKLAGTEVLDYGFGFQLVVTRRTHSRA